MLIEERLKRFNKMDKTPFFERELNEKIKIATCIEDYEWLEQLNKIKK